MEKLLELVNESVELDLKIKTNAKGVEAIHQTVRNTLKSDIINALVSDMSDLLGENGVVERTTDGVAVEVNIGGEPIVFTLDPVIKPLDFDLDHEAEVYADILAEREQREAERLAKKKKWEKAKAFFYFASLGRRAEITFLGRREPTTLWDDPNRFWSKSENVYI